MHVQIVYTESGRGLPKDSALLQHVFESLGHQVTITTHPPASENRLKHAARWHKALNRFLSPGLRRLALKLQRHIRITLNGKSRHDLIIHLQSIRPRHLYRNARHWLIPNQEWFSKDQLHYLNEIDTVLCKTRIAQELFSRYSDNTVFTGFSSPLIPAIESCPQKDFRKILHIAGNSPFKGTDTLLEVWRQHPEWPELTVVSNRHSRDESAGNIRILAGVSDETLTALWKTAGIAIQPSEVEGYGHALLEAQAYGCVVISTDAPPMNEVVPPSFGILVPYSSTQGFRLGTRYLVDSGLLEDAITNTLNCPVTDLQARSDEAFTHARRSHESFLRSISEVSDALEAGSPAGSVPQFPKTQE